MACLSLPNTEQGQIRESLGSFQNVMLRFCPVMRPKKSRYWKGLDFMQKLSYFSACLYIYTFSYHRSLHCFPRCPHTPSAGGKVLSGPSQDRRRARADLQRGLRKRGPRRPLEIGKQVHFCIFVESHPKGRLSQNFSSYSSLGVLCVYECVYKENTSLALSEISSLNAARLSWPKGILLGYNTISSPVIWTFRK